MAPATTSTRLFPDNVGFFTLLAMIVDEEPAEVFGTVGTVAHAGHRH